MSALHNPDLAISFLLACVAKTTILLTLAWIVTAFMRSRSAALRHAVWTGTILAALVMPLLAGLLPKWDSTVWRHASDVLMRPATALPTSVRMGLPAMVVRAVIPPPMPRNAVSVVLLIWLCGTLPLAMRLFVGLLRLVRISRTGSLFERLQDSLAPGAASRVRIMRCSDSGIAPLTWGVFHPQILVPASAAEWSTQRCRMVVEHELAHIRRHDWLWQMCAEIMMALYWFHPLAWIAGMYTRRESERACDDAVLNLGYSGPDYARELLDIVVTLTKSKQPWAAALSFARSSPFERRLLAMCNSSIKRRSLSTRATLITAVATLLVLIPLAAVRLPAQAMIGRFTGSVYDPSGAGVRNATVIMWSNARPDASEMTATDTDGNFSFNSLYAGDYELRVLKRGFADYQARDTRVESGQESSVKVLLKVADVTEEVEVVPDGTVKALPDSREQGEAKRAQIGGDLEAAKVVRKVAPVYPATAKSAGTQGTILLHAVIGVNGQPLSLRVMNKEADPDLARASVEAVSQWRYLPTLLNGQPIEVDTTIMVNFSLHP